MQLSIYQNNEISIKLVYQMEIAGRKFNRSMALIDYKCVGVL